MKRIGWAVGVEGGVNGTAPPRLHLQMTPIHAIYALHMDPLCLYVGLRKTGEKRYIARQREGEREVIFTARMQIVSSKTYAVGPFL
jgi:hypothetical protein